MSRLSCRPLELERSRIAFHLCLVLAYGVDRISQTSLQLILTFQLNGSLTAIFILLASIVPVVHMDGLNQRLCSLNLFEDIQHHVRHILGSPVVRTIQGTRLRAEHVRILHIQHDYLFTGGNLVTRSVIVATRSER